MSRLVEMLPLNSKVKLRGLEGVGQTSSRAPQPFKRDLKDLGEHQNITSKSPLRTLSTNKCTDNKDSLKSFYLYV